jgi:hypothetical protein
MRKTTLLLFSAMLVLTGAFLLTRSVEAQKPPTPQVSISVLDVTTGQPITNGEILDEESFYYQFTVTGNGLHSYCVAWSSLAVQDGPLMQIPIAIFNLNEPGFGNTFTSQVSSVAGGIRGVKLQFETPVMCDTGSTTNFASFKFYDLWTP